MTSIRLVSAAGAYLSDAVYQAVGEISVYLVPICLAASVLCLGFLASPWAVGLVAVDFFISGFYLPVISDLLKENLPSGKRATIISLSAVLGSLLSAAVDPALGRVADVFSLGATFRAAGLVLGCSWPPRANLWPVDRYCSRGRGACWLLCWPARSSPDWSALRTDS